MHALDIASSSFKIIANGYYIQSNLTLNSFIMQTFCTYYTGSFADGKFYYLIVFVINFHMNYYVNIQYLFTICVIAIHQYDIITEIVMVWIYSYM